MRIIAGRFKSRTLVAPKGRATRPTTDRARESLFNVLQNYISFEGLRVLDLFAGSGALGFEALSRGAGHATFVDKDRNAITAIKANADALSILANTSIISSDVLTVLRTTSNASFDVVFADPPYEEPRTNELPSLILQNRWVQPNGYGVIEHRSGTEIVLPSEATLVRELKAGEASFTIFTHAQL